MRQLNIAKRLEMMGLLFTALGVVGGVASAQTVRYTVTDLGALPASTVCPCFFANAISDNGIVTGNYFGPGNEHRGFIWQNGVITDVGGAPGVAHVPLGVNNDGVSVGFGPALAFRAQNGVVTDLPTLGGQFGSARAINNAGAIVGQSITSAATGSFQRATMWAGSAVTDLGTFGGEFSEAAGINDAGQVVGWAWNPARRQIGFVWNAASGMTPLPAPGGTSHLSIASDINELGQAVGMAEVLIGNGPQDQQLMFRAIIWNNGLPADLGDLNDPMVNSYTAGGINDHGQVVGSGSRYPDAPDRPFLWENGVMVDLNTLIDPASGWLIFSVADINNAGQIAATAQHTDGRRRAVLLNPIGTPCPADFNDDGVGDSRDFFDYLTAFFNASASADFNHNGVTDSQDFFEFLVAFFTGC